MSPTFIDSTGLSMGSEDWLCRQVERDGSNILVEYTTRNRRWKLAPNLILIKDEQALAVKAAFDEIPVPNPN